MKEDYRDVLLRYYTKLQFAIDTVLDKFSTDAKKRREAYDDELFIEKGHYLALDYVRSLIGDHLPVMPYNGNPMEIRNGLKSMRKYVYPEEWSGPLQDLEKIYKQGKKRLEVTFDQWGHYTIPMYSELKQLFRQVKARGIECALATLDEILLVESPVTE